MRPSSSSLLLLLTPQLLLSLLWILLLLFVSVVLSAGRNDAPHGGSRYITNHGLTVPISQEWVQYNTTKPIKEFHFHVYWHIASAEGCPHCDDSQIAALALREKLIEAVIRRDFVVVLNGVNSSILPGLNDSAIYPINYLPYGPHPCASFETWVPREYLAPVMSFFMLYRGELSVFFHPLSFNALEDHVGRSMWMGPSYRLNLNTLTEEGGFEVGGDGDPPQYPELGLGYSAPEENDIVSSPPPQQQQQRQWWHGTTALAPL